MAYWCAAQLQASRERLALHCLSVVNGFEVYSPRIRPARAGRGDDTRPLFPGYCFILIVSQWWAARWSPGIVRIVLDGAVPARVPDQVIDEIRRREVRGVVELPKPPGLQRGDKVRMCAGRCMVTWDCVRACDHTSGLTSCCSCSVLSSG
jgi:Transcription termination factor nusG